MLWTVSFRSLLICHNDERLNGLLHERYENTVNWNYMSLIRIFNTAYHFLVIASASCLLIACERVPNPKFSYLPRENTEAGDTIWFTNLSRAGDYFLWDFGDGNQSKEDGPRHVFTLPGVYEVVLSATNDHGEGTFSQFIPVNDPTVLGFIISDSSGTRALEEVEIWAYGGLEDLINQYNPHFHGVTDSQGTLYFQNVEARIYHIQVLRQEEKGYWAYRGITSDLKQNKVNRFTVSCIWYEGEAF